MSGAPSQPEREILHEIDQLLDQPDDLQAVPGFDWLHAGNPPSEIQDTQTFSTAPSPTAQQTEQAAMQTPHVQETAPTAADPPFDPKRVTYDVIKGEKIAGVGEVKLSNFARELDLEEHKHAKARWRQTYQGELPQPETTHRDTVRRLFHKLERTATESNYGAPSNPKERSYAELYRSLTPYVTGLGWNSMKLRADKLPELIEGLQNGNLDLAPRDSYGYVPPVRETQLLEGYRAVLYEQPQTESAAASTSNIVLGERSLSAAQVDMDINNEENVPG